MIGIYKITNLVNGKVYIGQSRDIEKRWNKHRWASHNSHLRAALDKYGFENFSFEILEETTQDTLNEREEYYVKLYEATDPLRGYNKIEGGIQGRPTIESRKRMSESHLGKPHPHTEEQNRKLSEALKGHSVSDAVREHIRKMNASRETSWNKGKPHSEEHKLHLREARKRRSERERSQKEENTVRYVNGAIDPASVSEKEATRLNGLLQRNPQDRDLLIKVINAPQWLLSDEKKNKMIYFLTDEDFVNEHFAMVWLVEQALSLANTADAYGGN